MQKTALPLSYLEYPDCNVWQGTVQQLLDAGVLAADQVPARGKVFNFFDGALTQRRIPLLKVRDERWRRVHHFRDGTVKVTAWLPREERIQRVVRKVERDVLAGRGVLPDDLCDAYGVPRGSRRSDVAGLPPEALPESLIDARVDDDFQRWLKRTVGYWTAHPNSLARPF